MTQLDISGGFYQSQSLPVSAQQLINAYVQTPETQGAFSDEIIIQTPGLVEEATTGDGVINRNRGALQLSGIPYFVNGSGLFSLAENGTVSGPFGTIEGESNQRVSMSQNGTQLMILVPGGDGYIYVPSTDTFTQITDPDFTFIQPQFVTFIDGYFACSQAENPKRWVISNLNDGLSWNALDFGSAEANPDDIEAPWAFKDRLYAMGVSTFEPFSNIGGADFPFQAVQGGVQTVGLTAPFSLVNGRNHFYWIGGGENEKPAIWRSQGDIPERVSNPAIESLIQQFSTVQFESVYATSRAFDGNFFVDFYFSDRALSLNEVNGRWQEIQSDDSASRIASVVEAYGNLYIGDTRSGIIGKIDSDLGTEYGENVNRTLATAPFAIDLNPFFLPTIELTMQTGGATLEDPNPEVRLSISRDGGRTYGNERARSMGGVGEFNRRVQWRSGNGVFDTTAVLKFEYSSSSKFIAIRLDANIVQGTQRFSA